MGVDQPGHHEFAAAVHDLAALRRDLGTRRVLRTADRPDHGPIDEYPSALDHALGVWFRDQEPAILEQDHAIASLQDRATLNPEAVSMA